MTIRILLSPVTSLKAIRMMQQSGWVLPFDTAWRAARIAVRPDELGYQAFGHLPAAPGRAALPQEPRHHQNER